MTADPGPDSGGASGDRLPAGSAGEDVVLSIDAMGGDRGVDAGIRWRALGHGT